MIIPATIVDVLPDDRLVIEYKVDNLARRCFAPHPLDMGPDAGVGTKVKLVYSDEHGVESLYYLSRARRQELPYDPSPWCAVPQVWRSIVVPAELKPATPSKPDAMHVLDDMQALITQHRREYAVFVHGLALLLNCEADPDTITAEVRKLVRPQPAKDVPR